MVWLNWSGDAPNEQQLPIQIVKSSRICAITFVPILMKPQTSLTPHVSQVWSFRLHGQLLLLCFRVESDESTLLVNDAYPCTSIKGIYTWQKTNSVCRSEPIVSFYRFGPSFQDETGKSTLARDSSTDSTPTSSSTGSSAKKFVSDRWKRTSVTDFPSRTSSRRRVTIIPNVAVNMLSPRSAIDSVLNCKRNYQICMLDP